MTKHPALTISLLSQLTDRQLQFNYLNHLDRTSEIATLLTQIIDRDLALRIVNLALEVDLNLGASLTAALDLDLQEIIVQQIDRLEINVDLKIKLWCRTKSKAALLYLRYLQETLVYTPGEWEIERTIELTDDAICYLNKDLVLDFSSLIHSFHQDTYFYDEQSLVTRAILSPEEINVIGNLLQNKADLSSIFVRNAIEALGRIGTPTAINPIRNALHLDRSRWMDESWIKGLGVVAEPEMVEHLIYLFHGCDDSDVDEDNSLCLCALEALEYIGGDLAFEILHRSLYWIDRTDDYRDPFSKIVETLFRLDRDRTLTAIEGAIHSYDPAVRIRAAIALSDLREIPIEDRNLSILLDALDDPEEDVRLEIATQIREIGDTFRSPYYSDEYSCKKIRVQPELLELAYTVTRPILIGYLSHPALELRQKAICVLISGKADEICLLPPFLVDASERDIYILTYHFNKFIDRSHLPILLKYLEHDRIELRAYALANLGTIGDDSILPVLVSFLNDPESSLRESAVTGILRLGSHATLPVLLELTTNRELITTMISELNRLSGEEPILPVFTTFLDHPDFTRQFLGFSETTLIEIIENDRPRDPNILTRLGSVAITDRSVLTIGKILRSNECTYEDEDGGVNALERIGTELAIETLLDLLPNKYVLGGWIANIFARIGKLGVIPDLWLSQRQSLSLKLTNTIEDIQKEEGLYNPNYSDRDYALFQPIDNLRRKILVD